MQFSQSVFSIAFDNAVEPDHHDERIPLMTWQSCAFTVQAVVWSVLDQGKSIFGQVCMCGRILILVRANVEERQGLSIT